MSEAIGTLCAVLAIGGCVCTLLETIAVAEFGRQRRRAADPPGGASGSAGVTVLKPLHGAEPGLHENLSSFVGQSFDGPVQFLFGASDAADPALEVVRRLQVEWPGKDIEAVVTRPGDGGNAKIANLIGLTPSIRHEWVVLSDSDIAVPPGYLRRTVELLGRPGVGLVTWLYRGEAEPGRPWARLAAMAIDHHFFPSVLLGVKLGRGRPCVGATMAFSRHTLMAIGGFAAFADQLADDHAIGAAVRDRGRHVVIAPDLVVHRCTESDAKALWDHELRWARTIRGIDPWGFAGSVVMHPLPLALLACGLLGADALASATLAAALVSRAVLQWRVDKVLGRQPAFSPRRLGLGPVRDILSFGVFCASFLGRGVVWRGRRFRVDSDGTMTEAGGPTP